MSRVTDLLSNLRFSVIGLLSTFVEWLVITGRNVKNIIGEFVLLIGIQLGKIVSFVKNRKEAIFIDGGVIVGTSFFSSFAVSAFMFLVSGAAVGYTNFLFLWLFFAAVFVAWFLSGAFRKS